MKYLLLLLLAIVSVACNSVSNPEGAVNRLQSRLGVHEAQIDSIAKTISYFPNGTQFAIALINANSTVFYGAYRENDSLMTVNNSRSVFEIGSLSKVFTSTLLADLVHQDKVKLDQSIQDFLDIQLNDSLQITFKQLSNHTSGLPRIPPGFVWESIWHMDNPYKNYDEEKLQNYLIEDIKLFGEQGKSFQYSNIGAGLLGYVLTKITGQSYEEMLQQRIFRPWGMSNSTTLRTSVTNNLVPGLNKQGEPTSNWDLGALPGAGAILSSAEDLAKFAIANFDSLNKMLTLQHKSTYRIDQDRDMALGWFIIKRNSNENWLWHNGGTGGYRSSMVLNVNQKQGVIILSNISTGHSHARKIDDLSFLLLQSLSNTMMSFRHEFLK